MFCYLLKVQDIRKCEVYFSLVYNCVKVRHISSKPITGCDKSFTTAKS